MSRGSAGGVAPRLVVDLGGGSTELVLGVDAPAAAISLDIGSVRLTERYLADGVTPAAEEAARIEVRELLDRAARTVDLAAAGRLVGLAGTITTVTAHALGLAEFDPEAIDGAELSVEDALAPAMRSSTQPRPSASPGAICGRGVVTSLRPERSCGVRWSPASWLRRLRRGAR